MEESPNIGERLDTTTIKLIVDKALLESEARSAAKISTTLTDQNVIYMNKIVDNAKETGRLTAQVSILTQKVDSNHKTLSERVDGLKGMVGYIGAASVALGGLVGFFIAQITGGK